MGRMLVGNGYVVTFGKENRVIENGAVLVEDDRIVKVGEFEALKNEKYDEFIDALGNVIMPGMVNCHMHLYSTFARGMDLKTDAPPANFPEILEKLWWRLDKTLTNDDVHYSAMIPLIDCIRAGTTTIIDHHASPNSIKGSLSIIENAVRQAGIKACLCYELSDRDGKKAAEDGIAENAEFAKKCVDSEDGYVTALFGMHASMTVSDETLNKAIEAAKAVGVGYHVHSAEDVSDVEDSRAKYGCGVIERWHRAGILGPHTILGHCIHITDHEMDLIKQSESVVVHNPESNMNNAVGTARVLDMLGKGLNLALGTDGMTSDMFQEMRQVNLIHKITNRDPRLAFCEAANFLIVNNPEQASKFFRNRVGTLEAGAYADIIILRYAPPTPLRTATFMGHLLFGLNSGMVDTTISNGRILMSNRALTFLDETEIAAKSRELAEKMWKRF